MTKLVVTNGFHSSRILHIKFQPGQYLYEVESYIDNVQLATGLMLALLFFLIYIFSGIRFFLFFANVPLLMMVYVLYGKRHDFIQVHKLKPGKKTSGVS